MVRRHSGGVINDWILYRYTRCFDSGVHAQTTSSKDSAVSRDSTYYPSFFYLFTDDLDFKFSDFKVNNLFLKVTAKDFYRLLSF
jgi:hypothetical protein